MSKEPLPTLFSLFLLRRFECCVAPILRLVLEASLPLDELLLVQVIPVATCEISLRSLPLSVLLILLLKSPEGLVSVHVLLSLRRLFLLPLNACLLGQGLSLLGYDLVLEAQPLCIVGLRLLLILESLILEHAVRSFCVLRLALTKLPGHISSLIIKILPIPVPDVSLPPILLVPESPVHLILVRNDGAPLVVHQFLLLNGQMPLRCSCPSRSPSWVGRVRTSEIWGATSGLGLLVISYCGRCRDSIIRAVLSAFWAATWIPTGLDRWARALRGSNLVTNG